MLLVDTLIFALLAWYLDKVGSGRVTEKPGPTQGKRERGGLNNPPYHNPLTGSGVKMLSLVIFSFLPVFPDFEDATKTNRTKQSDKKNDDLPVSLGRKLWD